MTNLQGLTIINNVDIWTQYGAFLVEEKRGGHENLAAILAPAAAKEHIGVDFRENDGVNYGITLDVKKQEREVTLHFAIVADTKQEWIYNYLSFIRFLKQGNNGWLNIYFPGLDLELEQVFYLESSNFKPLTCLWKEGKQISRFKVKFKDPYPLF